MLKKDALILALVIGLVLTGVCDAKMYEWVDQNGVLHLSNSPPPVSISEDNSSAAESEKSSGELSNPSVLPDTIRNVIVYGRKGCGLTQNMMSGLRRHRVSCVFQSIDNHAVSAQLQQKMEQTGKIRNSYTLPVVYVNGELLYSPKVKTVVKKYQFE